MKKYLSDLFKRKDLIVYLAASGLKAQHKNSFLGYFWWLLDPFLNVLIYYFVVVVVFHRPGGARYGMFLVTGMIIWRWLAATVITASNSIVSQAGIISQVSLPKAVFPISATLTHSINFCFGLVVIFLCGFYFGYPPGISIVCLPFIMTAQILFMIAIALPIAFACVFVRDVNNIVDHAMRLWFFGTPVIWEPEMIPAKGKWLLYCNPMTHILECYRSVLIQHSIPDMLPLIIICAASALVIFLAVYYYCQKEHLILKSL